MVRHASRFQLVLGLQRGYRLVSLGLGEHGLYVRGFLNDFGTPLAARGPLAELESLVRQLTR